MESAVTIGLDLGKSVFQVHGVDASGVIVIQRRRTRGAVGIFCEAARVSCGDGSLCCCPSLGTRASEAEAQGASPGPLSWATG